MKNSVALLSEEEQQVVRSRSFEELSFEEVADLAGLPNAESARTVYRKALRALGRRLGDPQGGSESL